MEDYKEWMSEQFSLDPLFDTARPSLPASAGELALGVFALHFRARKAVWREAELMFDTTHPPTMNAIRYAVVLSQAANKGRLEQELAGMTFRVEAQSNAPEDTILRDGTHPVRRGIGSVSGAYPPSFRVDGHPDSIRLYDPDAFYLINPLDANGMPQVTMQYIPPALQR